MHCCDFPVVRKLKVDKDLVDREPWLGSEEYLRVDINIFDSVGTPDLRLQTWDWSSDTIVSQCYHITAGHCQIIITPPGQARPGRETHYILQRTHVR